MPKHPRATQIGFFVPGWPLVECPNGIVSYVAALRVGLADLGLDSSLFVPRAARPEETEVVGVEANRTLLDRLRGAARARLGRPESPFADFDRALAARVRQRAKLGLRVFEMEETFGLIDRFRVPNVVRVARLHGPWFLNGEALGAERDAAFEERVRAEGKAIRDADAVSSPSADVLDQVRRFYGLELPTARVIPNPGPNVPPENTWSLETCKRHQVLFVGRFDRHKGGDIVLDAFSKLAASDPRVELVFAGPNRGLETDDGRRYDLDDYVAERVPAEFRSRLHLLGQTSPTDVARLRRESYLCIVASRYENFPMAAIEGLAYGCPMVGSRTGGIPEIVAHERTGLLFEPGDADGLASCVSRLLANPDEAQQYAAAGREEYARRFSPTVVAESMLAFYASVPGCILERRHA